MRELGVAVVGGGPAGMAAALSAAITFDAPVLLIERDNSLGGILNQCTHTGFGLSYFGEELTGQQYARRFSDRVYESEIEVLTDTTVVRLGADRSLTLSGAQCGFLRCSAAAIVMSTGCRERAIGSLPVCGTRPAGVFTAGTAQRMLNLGGYNLGKRFLVLGSGDVGMIVARTLVESGKEVAAVVEQGEKCGGLTRNRINCLEKFDIPLLTRTTVSEVLGIGRVTGVMLTSLESGEETHVPCDTLITSVGLIPERELLDPFPVGKPLPDWLFLCGNSCYVHDTVDDVTIEAERVGRLAALFADCGQTDESRNPDSADYGGRRDSGGSAAICIACPKGCTAVRTTGGWTGLKCGRSAPLLPDR